MKRAGKPDSVHRRAPCEAWRRDRHYSGPGVATPARCYLPANSPHGTTGRRSHGEPRPLQVGLLGIAARRDCPFHLGRGASNVAVGFPGLRREPTEHPGCSASKLVSVALILTSRWAAVSCCAVLCSPDVPPVPGFPYGTSGGLACFTGRIIAALAHVLGPGISICGPRAVQCDRMFALLALFLF